jgi:hypothetical protein
MTLLSIKSEVWVYSLITLGTEMLSSFFSFYYVKLFLEVYKISKSAFCQAQVRYTFYSFQCRTVLPSL